MPWMPRALKDPQKWQESKQDNALIQLCTCSIPDVPAQLWCATSAVAAWHVLQMQPLKTSVNSGKTRVSSLDNNSQTLRYVHHRIFQELWIIKGEKYYCYLPLWQYSRTNKCKFINIRKYYKPTFLIEIAGFYNFIVKKKSFLNILLLFCLPQT